MKELNTYLLYQYNKQKTDSIFLGIICETEDIAKSKVKELNELYLGYEHYTREYPVIRKT